MAPRKPEQAGAAPAQDTGERRTERMALGSILHADVNPKDHDIGAIIASFQKHRFVETPVLDERTQKLVAGHGRLNGLAAMKAEGTPAPIGVEVREDDWYVPIMRGWASADDNEARSYLLASNRTSELGGWNEAELVDELTALAKAGELEGTGFDGDAVDELTKALAEFDDADGPVELGKRKLATAVRPVFDVKDLETVEAAVKATGLPNRAEAFLAICKAYLERGRAA